MAELPGLLLLLPHMPCPLYPLPNRTTAATSQPSCSVTNVCTLENESPSPRSHPSITGQHPPHTLAPSSPCPDGGSAPRKSPGGGMKGTGLETASIPCHPQLPRGGKGTGSRPCQLFSSHQQVKFSSMTSWRFHNASSFGAALLGASAKRPVASGKQHLGTRGGAPQLWGG